MHCIGLGMVKDLVVWLIVIIGIVMIVQLLLPRIAGFLGPFGWIFDVLKIVMYVVIAIMVFVFCWDILTCAIGSR
jgi:hypothetical protein